MPHHYFIRPDSFRPLRVSKVHSRRWRLEFDSPTLWSALTSTVLIITISPAHLGVIFVFTTASLYLLVTMNHTSQDLASVMRSFRARYDQQNRHLSPAQREKGWQCYVTSSASSTHVDPEAYLHCYGSSVPQKRSASHALGVDIDSWSKRSGNVCPSLVCPCMV